MDSVTFNPSSIGNHPHRQLILQIKHPKNGVNTCPPISEYEIINAPKFSAVMMPFFTINAPNLVTDNLNLNNSDPILLQIPRNPQLSKRAFPLVAHRQYYRYKDLPMD